MKNQKSNLKIVVKIVRESLLQANKIRLPDAPPIYEIDTYKDYLDNREILRKELKSIRDRASKAITAEYGDSSEYVKKLDSFFRPESALQQLKTENNAFAKLLTSILDDLRLSLNSGRLEKNKAGDLSVDLGNVHANISLLAQRMDNALNQNDYPGVLHASASIFETMAKDIVGIQSVQDQTLKGFFARYRQDSRLPDEILDYILATYESRNATPLAGHGSTQMPDISREAAICLAEMTIAFVKIEYRLREKPN